MTWIADGECFAAKVPQTPKKPICEECDVEMHPFAYQTAKGWIEGWSCDECGWSFDTSEGGW